MPRIRLLPENNARQGVAEAKQVATICRRLPPDLADAGRAKLSATPPPIGSDATAMTIGTVAVAFLIARAIGVAMATTTSKPSRAICVASSSILSRSTERLTIAMLRSSVHPNPRSS